MREFLGLPADIERGSVWHAAFEAVFQCFDTEASDGGRVTWEEFVGRHKRAQALIKAKRPQLSLTEIREKVAGVWRGLDPYEAGMVTRVDLERDLMEMAFQVPSVRGLYDMVESRDAMVVDEDDWQEDLDAWILRLKQRRQEQTTEAKEQETGVASKKEQDRMSALLKAGGVQAAAEEGGSPQHDTARLQVERLQAEAEARRLQEEAEAAEKVAEASEAAEAHETAKRAWQAAAQHANLVSRLRQAEEQAKMKAAPAGTASGGSTSLRGWFGTAIHPGFISVRLPPSFGGRNTPPL